MKKAFYALAAVAVVIAIAGTALLSTGWWKTFVDIHWPFNKPWVGIRLTSGDVFYGKVDAVSNGLVRLDRAYALEKYIKQQGTSTENLNSQTFSLGAEAAAARTELFQVVKKDKAVYVSQANILFWEQIDASYEVYKYLQ